MTNFALIYYIWQIYTGSVRQITTGHLITLYTSSGRYIRDGLGRYLHNALLRLYAGKIIIQDRTQIWYFYFLFCTLLKFSSKPCDFKAILDFSITIIPTNIINLHSIVSNQQVIRTSSYHIEMLHNFHLFFFIVYAQLCFRYTHFTVWIKLNTAKENFVKHSESFIAIGYGGFFFLFPYFQQVHPCIPPNNKLSLVIVLGSIYSLSFLSH